MFFCLRTERGLLHLWEKALPAARRMTELQDFKLVCGGEEFPCSRFVLGAKSEVFRAMFSHEGTVEVDHKVAVIKDGTAEAVKAFLDFLYTGEANFSAKLAR